MAKNQIDLTRKAAFIKKVTEFDKGGKKGEIKFIFRNGTEVVAILDEISVPNQHHAFVHGASQKFGDVYAGCSLTNDFSGAFDLLQNVIGQLATDDWSSSTSFGGNADLMQAVSTVMKQSLEDVQTTWETLDEAGKKTWFKHSGIKAEVLKIKSARLDAQPKPADEQIAGF